MLKRNFYKLVDRIFQKTWTEEHINKYIGTYKQCFFTYATDTSLRERSASGGSVTALLTHMLHSKMISGALVVRTVIQPEDKVRPQFFIARTVEELKSAQGSKYSAVYFGAQAIPLIKAFNQPVAVVALPCDTRILRQAMRNDLTLRQNVKVIITLFCGHNSEPYLTDFIVEKLKPKDASLLEFIYSTGHWRGQLVATFDDNNRIIKPSGFLKEYFNLYFFTQKKCQHCYDHTGYYGDISAGDIWSQSMRNNPIKHTAIITRSEMGDAIVCQALSRNVLSGYSVTINEVCDGQTRILPTHYNITARSKLHWIVNERIKDPVKEEVRLVDFLVAAIYLFNVRLSQSVFGRKVIPRIPRIIIKFYLYIFKFIESL